MFLIVTVMSGLAGCGSDTPNQEGLNKLNPKNVNPAVAGDNTVTWFNSTSGSVYGMTLSNGAVSGGALFYQGTSTALSIVGQADFDGDGIRDFVWWNNSTGEVYIMLMASPIAVKSVTLLGPGTTTTWRIVATGDINGDGKADLIWWNNSTGQVYAMLINGTSVAGGGFIYTEPDTNWKIVASADFIGSGKMQLLWWNRKTGQVAIGQTNGTNASTSAIICTESNTDWRIAGAGDLNGDGKADIVWHNRTTGQLYGMQTNGSSVTNGAMIYTEPNTQWEIESIRDYTGDNKADILWWNRNTGQVFLMYMNGWTVAGGSLLYTEPDTTWNIQGETRWRDAVYGKGVTTTAANPGWTFGLNMPTASYWSASAVNGNDIYIIGGANTSGYYNAFMKYNTLTNSWTTLPVLPFSDFLIRAANVDGKIYVFKNNSPVYRYDIASGIWTKLNNMPVMDWMGTPAVVNSRVYIFGSYNGGGSKTALEYNPANDTWTTKAPMPTGRYAPSTAVLNNKIYVLGGNYGNTKNELYDPATDTWQSKADIPFWNGGWGVAGQINGNVFFVNNSDDKMAVYFPATDTWKTMSGLAMPRDYLTGETVNGKLYVIGGQISSPYGTSDSVDIYSPSASLVSALKSSSTSTSNSTDGQTDYNYYEKKHKADEDRVRSKSKI